MASVGLVPWLKQSLKNLFSIKNYPLITRGLSELLTQEQVYVSTRENEAAIFILEST